MIRNRRFLLLGLAVAIFLAGVVSYYASSSPDGLAKVAADKGINARQGRHALSDSPLAGYGTKGGGGGRLSGAVAGVAGVGLTLLVGGALFMVVRRRGPGPDGRRGDAADHDADHDADPADNAGHAYPARQGESAGRENAGGHPSTPPSS